MCGTTNSWFQSSNTLNNTGIWSLIELASLYTVPLSAINSLSHLTTSSNGQARPIWKFSNQPITFESNRNGRFQFKSNLEASQVPSLFLKFWLWLYTKIIRRMVKKFGNGCVQSCSVSTAYWVASLTHRTEKQLSTTKPNPKSYPNHNLFNKSVYATELHVVSLPIQWHPPCPIHCVMSIICPRVVHEK